MTLPSNEQGNIENKIKPQYVRTLPINGILYCTGEMERC